VGSVKKIEWSGNKGKGTKGITENKLDEKPETPKAEQKRVDG